MKIMKAGFLAIAALLSTASLAKPTQDTSKASVEACRPMRWTTLGTAGGPVPTQERSEPANLLTADGQDILVDTGDGTVTQLARTGRGLDSIRTVFISHHHYDHTGGLAAVIGLRWMNNYSGALTIYGPPGTREIVDGILMTMAPQSRVGFGLGAKPTPPSASVNVIELTPGSRVQLGKLVVSTSANSHYEHGNQASPNDAVSLSYRFQLGPRSITYTGDTGPSDEVTALAAGSDMLVSEVIDLDRLLVAMKQQRPDMPPALFENMQRHLSTHHLTAASIGTMARAAKVGKIVLTHFAIPPGPTLNSEPILRTDIGRSFNGPVEVAIDLASYDVGCEWK